ncbi:MAG: SulP family inorganic anion transporter [Desulfotomaculaceae bacterium]
MDLRNIFLKVKRSNILSDLYAGFVLAAVAMPNGMAAGLLAGVNPIFGLYSLIIGAPVAAIFTGSVFMSVDATGSTSLIVGGVMSGYQEEARVNALVTIVLVAAIVQIAAGLLRLGFLTRFISTAVMTGFFYGIIVSIVLSQLGNLTGYQSEYSNRIAQTADLIWHITSVDIPTLLVGLGTIVFLIIMRRTRFLSYSLLAAVVLAAFLVWILGLDSVRTVRGISTTPIGLPRPFLPNPLLDFNLALSGIAVAVIGLLQGAGVSNSYANPDGKYGNPSRNFLGQGIANLAVSFFRGIPVGGSISSSALLVSSGARSRWARIFAGILAAFIVWLMPDFLARLPLAVLAAVLIVVDLSFFDFERIRTVWEAGFSSRTVMLITFILIMVLPVYIAVLAGVVIHVILHIFHSAERVKIMQFLPLEDGRYAERPAGKRLEDQAITILMPVGSLFYAGAIKFEEILPSAEGTSRAVVIMRLRGRHEVGSTFLLVIKRYAETLKKHDGKLVLVGVNDRVNNELKKTGILESLGSDNVFLATHIRRESLEQAISSAKAWLAESQE